MSKKIVVIVGSYRKNGIIDQTVDAILEVAGNYNTQTQKIYLIDRDINFCTNCRSCMSDDPAKEMGKCIFDDDMSGILASICDADGIILGSPVNFGTVTAIMKRFVERCAVFGYWPWDKPFPKSRVQRVSKKAVVVTSSACPAFIAKFLMPCALKVMRNCARVIGAKKVKSLYFGMVCKEETQKLNKNQLKMARSAGEFLSV